MSLVLLVGCSGDKSTTDAPDPPSEEIDAKTSVEESEQLEEPEAGRGGGGTLRLFYHQAPTIVNPHLSQGNKDLNASCIVYEPLVSFDKDGDMIPLLAAEIPSIENGGVAPDGTSVTWKLKEGVMWSDGEPFTADDVLFTFEYITNPDVKSTSTGAYSSVKSVEVIDDTTVKINFKKLTAACFLPFVEPQGMVIPRYIFEDYKGVVFIEFLEMAEDRFSPDVTDIIIDFSDLVSGGAYTTIGTYDHDELLQLITHLSYETDLSVPEIVRTLSVYPLSRFNTNYPQLFEGVHTTFRFLERIDGQRENLRPLCCY